MDEVQGTVHAESASISVDDVHPGVTVQKWTILSHVSGNGTKALWVCECECGTRRAVIIRDILAGKSKSCGCIRGDAIRRDLSGKRFGSLVVVGLFAKSTHGSSPVWRCICDCGRESFPTGRNLRNGNTTSCGNGQAHRLDTRVTSRIETGEKTCCRCKETKAISDFYRKRTRDGYGSHCKVCNNKKNAERHAQYLETDREAKRKWRSVNRDHLRRKCNNFYASHSESIREKRRNSPSFRQAKQRDQVRGKQRFARRAKQMWKGAEVRCRQCGFQFSLTPEFIEERLRTGCCEVTGLPFDFVRIRGPFSPSLDRVCAGGGYTPDNVQVVVWCYNAAKGTWDKADVVRMAKSLLKMEKQRNGRASTSVVPKAATRQRRLEFVS